MSNILVEVDEAMKQERVEKLWKQYGGFFLGFLAIIILGTIANAGYGSWIKSKNIKQTDLLLSVINKTDYNAQDMIQLSTELKSKLRNIVKLNAAGLLVEENKIDDAISNYNNLAKNSDQKDIVKQLATYMSIKLSQNLSAEEKLSKLEAIQSNKKNPLRYHASLDSALIEANIINNYIKARSHLSNIINSASAPKTLRQKAQSLDILYALKERTSNTK